ncbi:hypothetical protein MYX82_01225 [Acidobacteria bacterium AH-259-D05]|nr:hypothetical protein [Acidobacteria bacterium AH-259-D05]
MNKPTTSDAEEFFYGVAPAVTEKERLRLEFLNFLAEHPEAYRPFYDQNRWCALARPGDPMFNSTGGISPSAFQTREEAADWVQKYHRFFGTPLVDWIIATEAGLRRNLENLEVTN